MSIPSFDSFWQEMRKEKIEEWANAATESDLKVCLPLTEDNVNDFIQTVVTASFIMSREMLKGYHQWLCKQLERKFSPFSEIGIVLVVNS